MNDSEVAEVYMIGRPGLAGGVLLSVVGLVFLFQWIALVAANPVAEIWHVAMIFGFLWIAVGGLGTIFLLRAFLDTIALAEDGVQIRQWPLAARHIRFQDLVRLHVRLKMWAPRRAYLEFELASGETVRLIEHVAWGVRLPDIYLQLMDAVAERSDLQRETSANMIDRALNGYTWLRTEETINDT